MAPDFILQRDGHGMICALIALYNACIYYGVPHPTYPSELWEAYKELAGAQYGAAISPQKVATHLGLVEGRLDLHGPDWKQVIASNLPVSLDVWSPGGGTSLHIVLVIEADEEGATLVNYRSEAGPVVERLPWGDDPPMKEYKPDPDTIKQWKHHRIKPKSSIPDRSMPWMEIYLPCQGNVNRRAWAIRTSKDGGC